MEPKYIKMGVTTCYLLECEEGYLQIDTSYPAEYKKFKTKLNKKYNIHPSEIKFLLLTHHHDDHAGFAADFLNNTNAKLIVHEKAIPQLKKGKSEEGESSYYVNKRVKTIMGLFEKFHKFEFPPVTQFSEDYI
ncbi:MAG: MBL fold metallo-hydrolase, partial [Candidatus Lokiarchaeota archaeon]|nr:MBL fold metallo-hydrolase [Candidatus Lokiarchaeota archaeon]MBD3342861.1 MBL fold metallo-hydrolase [Candidatus Lokiarchaeota archaeon]